ncbi:HEAT repeat domain-containing protein [Pontiellaceae bacterium B12227]|nr:HEAT repeat domain-containing protein [Pontiellaceae bacterium B12227]
MKRILSISFLLAASLASAQFEAIKTLTPEQAQEIRRPVEAKVFGAAAEELPGIESELLNIFQSSETTLEGKQYTCRMLRHCASDASVPVLEKELLNPELAEFVRRVFQSLETPAANEALLEALAAGPNVGIIGTLGQIGSEKSIAAIAPYLENENADLQFAAITALGNIGGKKAVKALEAATVKPEFSNDWKLAQLEAAEGVGAGWFGLSSKGSEKKIVAKLLEDDDAGIRCAALVRLTAMKPGKAAPVVLGKLDSDNKEEQTAAKGLLAQLPTDRLIEAVQSGAEYSVIIIDILTDRKAVEAETLMLSLVTSKGAAVQQAAFQALTQIGGDQTIGIMVGLAPYEEMAFQTLCGMKAQGTDAAIIQTLETTEDDKVKSKLIECLSARQAKSALPLFVELAKGDWSRTSAAAISGMANLVTETDFAIYAELILATDAKKKIQALENSIATAAQRLPDAEACAQPLVDAYKQGEGEQKLALIRAMGSIGGTAAKNILGEAMASSDANVKDAAIRGLCNWPNTEVQDQLLDLAENADSEKHKVLALRGYIRLANTYNEEKTALPMCIKAAALTDRPEELKSIIACAKRFRSEDVINFLAPMLENPAIVDEAGQGMIEQTWHWKYKMQALPHLERYVELTQNEHMKKYAQDTINSLKN